MHLLRVVEDEIQDVQLVLGVHPDVGLVAGHPVEGLGTLVALVEASVPAVHRCFASTTGGHPVLSLPLIYLAKVRSRYTVQLLVCTLRMRIYVVSNKRGRSAHATHTPRTNNKL